ncbi:unnamed protein product [Meloidogyne enterolobii]|uniref:Uncharacterized protein n=1 Tax=Meloidogyne enterolobii TaxID=390850 RepID=A0ACB1A4Z9_MELEN
MKTITTKFEWTVYDIKKIREVLTYGKSLHLTSERFYSAEFPIVFWELHINLIKLEYNNIYIWLRQLGPDNINAFVNTKYKIYAAKKHNHQFTYVDIAKFELSRMFYFSFRSTYKFEGQSEMGYSFVSLDSVVQVDGLLRLHCEVEFDCYSLTYNLQDTYRKMLEKETFTDFVIKVWD